MKDAPADPQHQRTMPPDKRSKSLLVALAGKAFQQLAVGPFTGRGGGELPFEVSQSNFQRSAGYGSSFPGEGSLPI